MFQAFAEAADVAMEISPSAASSGSFAVIVLPILCFAAVFLMIWYKAAKNFALIASDKGYTEKKWFHYCFWLGPVGMLMVCAMPDKKSRRQ